MQTIPIDDDPDFRALEAHAQKRLLAKGYERRQGEPSDGSTSWRVDPRLVCFKLCLYPDGPQGEARRIFFGAREDWAKAKGVSLNSVGSERAKVSPHHQKWFRGEYIENDTKGKHEIDRIIDLFP
jgi:hypothetical protein